MTETKPECPTCHSPDPFLHRYYNPDEDYPEMWAPCGDGWHAVPYQQVMDLAVLLRREQQVAQREYNALPGSEQSCALVARRLMAEGWRLTEAKPWYDVQPKEVAKAGDT